MQNVLEGPFKEIKMPINELNQRALMYDKEMRAALKRNQIEWHGLMHAFFVDPGRVAATPVGNGLPQITNCNSSSQLFWKQWSSAVWLALKLANLKFPKRAAEAPGDKLKELLGAGAFTLLAGPYPAVHESNDDRGFAAFGFYTYEDCDGKSMNVCNNFTLLMKLYPEWKKQNMEPSLPLDIAEHFFLHFYFDPVFLHTMTYKGVAHGKGGEETISTDTDCRQNAAQDRFGHIIVLFLRRKHKNPFKEALIIDGTCLLFPHIFPYEAYSRITALNMHKIASRVYGHEFLSSNVHVGISGFSCEAHKTYYEIPIGFTSKQCIAFKSIANFKKPYKKLSLHALISGEVHPVVMPSNDLLKDEILDRVPAPHCVLDLDNVEAIGINNFSHQKFKGLTMDEALQINANMLVAPYDVPCGISSQVSVAPFVTWAYWNLTFTDYGTGGF